MFDGVTIDLTRHARERFRERVDPAGTDPAVVALVRRAYPCRRKDHKRHRVPRRSCRYVAPGGLVVCVAWVTPARCRVTTVIAPDRAEGAA